MDLQNRQRAFSEPLFLSFRFCFSSLGFAHTHHKNISLALMMPSWEPFFIFMPLSSAYWLAHFRLALSPTIIAGVAGGGLLLVVGVPFVFGFSTTKVGLIASLCFWRSATRII